MVTAISGLAGTNKNSFTIGDGSDGYNYIYINNNLLFNAGIRYNNTDEYWELTNDGTTWTKMNLVSPGYLGDDGYVLTMVLGAPDWAPNNQIASSDLRVGDNTLDVVSIEFRTATEDASINYDGYLETLYLDNVDGIQTLVMTDVNDNSSIPYGDYTSNTTSMHMKTTEGDGYVIYNAALGTLEKRDDGYIQSSYLVETERGDINTLVIGNYSGNDATLKLKTLTGDGYLNYNSVSGNLEKQNAGETETSYLIETEIGDINTLVLGDYSSDTTTIHMNNNTADGYLVFDSNNETFSLKIGNDNAKYSVLMDGYDTTSGNIIYATGTEYSALSIGSQGQVMSSTGSIPSWSSDLSLPNDAARTVEVATSPTDTAGKDLSISAGDAGTLSVVEAASGGDLNLSSGTRSGSISSAADGDINFNVAGSMIGSFSRIIPSQDHYFRLYTDMYFDQTQTPIVSQDANTASVDGYAFTIKAQDAANDYDGAPLHLQAGDSGSGGDGYGGFISLIPGENTGSGKNGNIFLQNAPTNPYCNNMENGIYIGDVTSVPDGYSDFSNGGYLYSESGALKWMGASGTETTIGPADPHCPRCGRDFAVQWKNNGEKLAICMWCLTKALTKAGISEEDYLI